MVLSQRDGDAHSGLAPKGSLREKPPEVLFKEHKCFLYTFSKVLKTVSIITVIPIILLKDWIIIIREK